MWKPTIFCCVAALLLATAGKAGHAAPWGSRSDPSYYLGKDYTGDWEGALQSLRSGKRGYMGGQLPRAQDTAKEPKTKQQPKSCC